MSVADGEERCAERERDFDELFLVFRYLPFAIGLNSETLVV